MVVLGYSSSNTTVYGRIRKKYEYLQLYMEKVPPFTTGYDFLSSLPRSNTHGRKRPVPMKFPWFHGSSIPMNGSSGRIYSVSAWIDRNLLQPATVCGHRVHCIGFLPFSDGVPARYCMFPRSFHGKCIGILLPGNIDLGVFYPIQSQRNAIVIMR